MKLHFFLLFLVVCFPLLSSTKFLQLFDTLSSENSNNNGFSEQNSQTTQNSKGELPSLIDYLKDNSSNSYSFKQIPDEIPKLSVTIPLNDDYLKDSFTETSVDIGSLEKQAENLIHTKGKKKNKELDMGKALQKTRDFIQKAINDDLSVGVSKDDLMNLLSFSNKILEKCKGDFQNCKHEEMQASSTVNKNSEEDAHETSFQNETLLNEIKNLEDNQMEIKENAQKENEEKNNENNENSQNNDVNENEKSEEDQLNNEEKEHNKKHSKRKRHSKARD